MLQRHHMRLPIIAILATLLIGNAAIAQQDNPDFEPKCQDVPGMTDCWLAVDDRPGCWVWNTYRLNSGERDSRIRYSWSGACDEGQPHGWGVEQWGILERPESGPCGVGTYSHGKRQGHWLLRLIHGNFIVMDGPHPVFAKEGTCTTASDNVETGMFLDDERHGIWVECFYGGCATGPYSNGKEHGHWIARSLSSTTTISYKDGKRHGEWTRLYKSGKVSTTLYVNGRPKKQ